MKAKLFFMSLLATAFFYGCSSDESIIDPGNGGTTGEPQFITVNLVTTGASTRGEGDQSTTTAGEDNAPESGKIYEEGLEAENKVETARFYFFDESGKGANVRYYNGKLVNYLDWTPEDKNNTNMPNVEKILGATLILQTPKGDKMPSSMVVIVNPGLLPTTNKQGEPLSLSELKEVYENYAKKYTGSGSFVMSNSTYAKDGTEMIAVSVSSNIKNKKEDAENNPVNVYVERTVAKVRLYLDSNLKKGPSINKDEKTIQLYDPSKSDPLIYGEKKIYVRFLGWNVTAAADASRLIKKINPVWDNTLLGSFGLWNWDAYFRSFWAVNVNTDDNGKQLDYQYGPFQEKNGVDKTFVAQLKTEFNTESNKNNYVYLNENASDDFTSGKGATTPSKVIIAAQLVDESGNALEFAEYGSGYYSWEGIKNLFAENCGLYKKTTEGEETKYVKITPAELVMKSATEAGMTVDEDGKMDKSKPRYKVYLQLTEAAEKENWYPSNDKNQTDEDELGKDGANAKLRSFGSVKAWKQGYTYYYFDIEHGTTTTITDGVSTTVPNKGVVRNHIYDATVTSLVGLGTPVYNPDEVIYPEKPTPGEDTYLAARIHILSWRVVKNDVALEW